MLFVSDVLPTGYMAAEHCDIQPGDVVTHRLPLDEAPRGYAIFDEKDDGCVKVVLKP